MLGLMIFSSAIAEEKKYNIYVAQAYDSVEKIAQRFLPTHQREYGNHIEEYINDLKFWNPHVKNWKSIPEYTEIYVDYPYPPYPAPALSVAQGPPVSEFIETEETEQFSEEGRVKLFSMFTLSQGSFNETLTTSTGKIKSQQNSPFTLGIGGNYLFNGNTDNILATSAYWSFLKMSEVSGDTALATSSIKVPNEIGANFYLQHAFKEFDISPYAGLDYEKFSTFNTTEYIEQGASLSINTNTILLATLGVSKPFIVGEQTIITKLSMASVFSATSSAGTGNKFTGQRFLLFAGLHGADKFSYNFLYKRHILKGPTNLTIDRIGIGLSYDLF